MHVRLFFLQAKNLASEIIKNGGPESLVASLNKIENLGGDVYYDEISMDFLGFKWIEMGKITEAIEVYKLNVQAFPESFSTYNSLGVAYMRNGDNENALVNFKKSLTLNPDNKNAETMLKKLETK
jgi:tetratricopeptide (TPR) repeat protein